MAHLIEEAKAGNVEGVRRELNAGAYINQLDSGRDTALTWSSYLGHTEVVRLLLERGADISIPNAGGSTPLKLAQSFGKPDVAKLLEASVLGTRESWHRTGEQLLAHIGVYHEIGQKLTTVFNFKSRDRIIIAENIARGTQGVSAPTSFDAMPREAVEEAFEQFTRFGGIADKDFVLSGASSLDKPKMKLPGS